jgi:hypothetical protein
MLANKATSKPIDVVSMVISTFSADEVTAVAAAHDSRAAES